MLSPQKYPGLDDLYDEDSPSGPYGSRVKMKNKALDSSSTEAGYGAVVYRDADSLNPHGVKSWNEDESAKEWRQMMDEDGRHQRFSELSRATEGDMRVIGTIERGVLYKQEMDAATRRMSEGMEDSGGQQKQREKERQFRNRKLLEHLDKITGRPPSSGDPLAKSRAKLVVPRTPSSIRGLPTTKTSTSLIGGTPLGNKLTPMQLGALVPGASVSSSVSLPDIGAFRSDSASSTPSGGKRKKLSKAEKAEKKGLRMAHAEAVKREAEALRVAFVALDADGDGKLGIADLQAAYHKFGCKLARQTLMERIFEVDDDCDGKIGWEECSNVWVRGKKPLGRDGAANPREIFNLLDFAVLDVAEHQGQLTGRVPYTQMLALFKSRYGKIAEVELMEETDVGDAAKGVKFKAYLARAERMHDALFYADKVQATSDLQEKHRALEMMSQGGPSGKYKRSAKEVRKRAKKNAESFAHMLGTSTGRSWEAAPAGGKDGAGGGGGRASGFTNASPRSSVGRAEALMSSFSLSSSGTTGAAAARLRRLRGSDELFKWAGLGMEQRTLIELYCRQGEKKQLMIELNNVLKDFAHFQSDPTLSIELCDLMRREIAAHADREGKMKGLSPEEHTRLLELADLVRQSTSQAMAATGNAGHLGNAADLALLERELGSSTVSISGLGHRSTANSPTGSPRASPRPNASLTNASTDNTTVAGGGDGSDRAEEGKKKPPHPHHMPSLQEVNAELNWEENDGIMHSGDTPRGPASGIDYDAVLRQQGGLMTRQQISHLPPRGEKQNSGGNNVHFEL